MQTSRTLDRIRRLAAEGRILVSAHGYDELAADDIFFSEIVDGLEDAEIVEDYPGATKGPSVLVLQHDYLGWPVHVVWGMAKGADGPAYL